MYLKLKVFITLSRRFVVGIYNIRDKHIVEAFARGVAQDWRQDLLDRGPKLPGDKDDQLPKR